MKIAIHIPPKLPFSIENYIKNVTSILVDEGVIFYRFYSKEELESIIQDVDLIWFPNCAGGSAPSLKFINIIGKGLKPVVVTLHGAAPFSVPSKLYYSSIKSIFKGETHKYINFLKWQVYKKSIKRIITVSNYAKHEISKKLKLPEGKINVVHHGVDFNLFTPNTNLNGRKYLLHISQYQPIKNVVRIIEAYKMLNGSKPELILIIPGFKESKKYFDKKIKIIDRAMSSQEVAKLYKEAIVFLFPSLHETFGMPILEAMACGCPVITSNVSACPEVAGDAALLVNPYSVKEIAEAMERIIRDEKLREELSKKGIKRAREFTWEQNAKKHLEVFEQTLRSK